MKDGWQIQPLEKVVTVRNGGTPKSKVEEYWGNEVEWLTPKDMGKMDGIYISETPRKITELGLSKCSAKLAPANSVIMSTRAPIGHLAINTVPMSFNQGCRGMTPLEGLDIKYLFYFLSGKVPELNALGTGATFKELSSGALKNFSIPVPPLEEQKRIVAILDEAFAGLDRARAHTEANLQNARDLFESQLKEAFSNPENNWTRKRLEDVTSKIGSGATPRGGASSYKSEGISLVRSMNVHDRKFVKRKLAFIDDEQASKLSNVTLEPNDVLLNITGASVARCCVLPDKFLPARVNQHVSILRANDNELSSDFLCYMLTSEVYKDTLLGIGEEGGATRQAITKAQLQALEIQFPSLKEQKEHVVKLDGAEKSARGLQLHYQTKLKDLDDLRQSLLQKAFAGELT